MANGVGEGNAVSTLQEAKHGRCILVKRRRHDYEVVKWDADFKAWVNIEGMIITDDDDELVDFVSWWELV